MVADHLTAIDSLNSQFLLNTLSYSTRYNKTIKFINHITELTLKSQFFQMSSLSCRHLPAAITDRQIDQPEPLTASCTACTMRSYDQSDVASRHGRGESPFCDYVIVVKFHVHASKLLIAACTASDCWNGYQVFKYQQGQICGVQICAPCLVKLLRCDCACVCVRVLSMVSLWQEINVSYEDQMRICQFARKNARLVDIQEQISSKEVSGSHFVIPQL